MPWLISAPRAALCIFADRESETDIVFEELRTTLRREQKLWRVRELTLTSGIPFPVPDSVHKLHLQKKLSGPADFIQGGISWTISDRVVEAIEELEPGVHRYWPVDVFNKDGSLAGRWWFLNICNRLDALDLEKSKVKGKLKEPDGFLVPDFIFSLNDEPLPNGPELLICRREAVKNYAIWCEYRLRNSLFISDALKERLDAFDPPLTGIGFELQTGLS